MLDYMTIGYNTQVLFCRKLWWMWYKLAPQTEPAVVTHILAWDNVILSSFMAKGILDSWSSYISYFGCLLSV